MLQGFRHLRDWASAGVIYELILKEEGIEADYDTVSILVYWQYDMGTFPAYAYWQYESLLMIVPWVHIYSLRLLTVWESAYGSTVSTY